MRVTIALAVSSLLASTGCPKSSAPAKQPRTNPPVVAPAPPDAGVPVVAKPLPPYKPKYTRKPARLWTSSSTPWFAGRVVPPNLTGLPQSDVALPPKKLPSEVAINTALKTADPKKADYYELQAGLAYHLYQKAALKQKTLSAFEKLAARATNFRTRYMWHRRLSMLRADVRRALSAAIAQYRRLASSAEAKQLYPDLPRALYHYGLALEKQRQWRSAQNVWDGIIRDYDKSEAAGASHLALAELHFRRGDYGSARRHYEQVSAQPVAVAPDPWRELRHVWALVRTRDTSAFATLEKLATGAARTLNRTQHTLFQQHVSDLAPWAYAITGQPAGALAAFGRVDRKHALTMVRKLSDIYASQRQRKHATELYAILLTRSPDDPDACLWRFYAMAQKLAGEPTETSFKALQDTIAMYKKADSAHLLPSEGQRKCENAIRMLSMNMARRLHRSARAKPSADAWLAAEKLYKLHIDTFTPATAVHADYAELLWRRAELEKDPRAALQLWQTAGDQFLLLSHRAWKRLSDKARTAAAQAWSNAAVIVETGYTGTPDLATAAALYKRACEVAQPVGFTPPCADHSRLSKK